MDPLLFSLALAWLLVRGAEEVPYAIQGKTSPRMAAKLAKARNTRAAAGKPTSRRAAARDFFSGLWADSWDSADQARRRMRDTRPQKKAEGRLWWQRAGRAGKAVGGAFKDLADWALYRKLPDLPDLDDPADFNRAAEAAADEAPKSDTGESGEAREKTTGEPVTPPPPRQDSPEPEPGSPVQATAERLDDPPPTPAAAAAGDELPVLDAEVVCDGGVSCANSDLGVQEAIDRGLCPGCGGRRELVWNFGGEHGHRTCPDCRGTGRCTPFTNPRLQLEAANSEENPFMSANAETTKIDAAIAFAGAMAEEGQAGVTTMETFTESLTAGEVTGKPLELAAAAQELYSQIASVFTQERAELERHLVIAEQYAAVNNEAGSKAFNTDG